MIIKFVGGKKKALPKKEPWAPAKWNRSDYHFLKVLYKLKLKGGVEVWVAIAGWARVTNSFE
jgi:hypothetical protein